MSRSPLAVTFVLFGVLGMLVVEYSREFQTRAADELDLMPEGSAIAEMLSDYAVIRDQARACRS